MTSATRRARLPIFILFLISLIFVSCMGDDDEDPTATPVEPTATEVEAEATATPG
ncbi:MAG: hypothetical protein R2849_00150 [Thermomicrobiales bacterium]